MLSATAFLLVILPILVVPFTLNLDKSPATHEPMRSEAAQQPEPMLGVTVKSINSRGWVFSTTGSHEATSLAKSMEIKGSTFHVVSSDVCIDPTNDRVIVPSRVPSVCTRQVVKAFNITVLVASYNCSRSAVAPDNSNRDIIVKLFNISEEGRGHGQRIKAKCPNFAVITCDTFYHLQEADVTWHGKGHVCKIQRCDVTDTAPRPYANANVRKDMSSLKLALANALDHLVDSMLLEGEGGAFEDFYGVIHAAATAIRSIGNFPFPYVHLADPFLDGFPYLNRTAADGMKYVYASDNVYSMEWGALNNVAVAVGVVAVLTALITGWKRPAFWEDQADASNKNADSQQRDLDGVRAVELSEPVLLLQQLLIGSGAVKNALQPTP